MAKHIGKNGQSIWAGISLIIREKKLKGDALTHTCPLPAPHLCEHRHLFLPLLIGSLAHRGTCSSPFSYRAGVYQSTLSMGESPPTWSFANFRMSTVLYQSPIFGFSHQFSLLTISNQTRPVPRWIVASGSSFQMQLSSSKGDLTGHPFMYTHHPFTIMKWVH